MLPITRPENLCQSDSLLWTLRMKLSNAASSLLGLKVLCYNMTKQCNKLDALKHSKSTDMMPSLSKATDVPTMQPSAMGVAFPRPYIHHRCKTLKDTFPGSFVKIGKMSSEYTIILDPHISCV